MEKEQQGAGEAVEPTVEGEEGTPQEEGAQDAPDTPSDPLDAIADEDERNEAKRLRAIERRNAKKVEEPEEPAPAPEYATKADLEKMAMNEAKKILAPEVLEVMSELAEIPLGGYDSLDAESIAKNLARRYIVYREENPLDGHDPKKALITTPQNSAQSGIKPEKKTETSLPGYKEPVSPDQWYPAKE